MIGGGGVTSKEKACPPLMAARLGGQPVRHRLGIGARPQGDRGDMELEGEVRAAEEPVVSGRGQPRAAVVVVVRAGRHEADTGHGQCPRFRGAGQPDHRAGGRVHVAGGGGGEHDLVRRGRHAPGGEHHRHPLARHGVIGEALHRDLAGLGAADPRVVDAGHVRVGGHRLQDLAGGPEVLSGEAEERVELPGLAEPGRVGGGVGHPGREGEGGEHAQDAGHRAEQGRPDRHGRPPAPGFEREPGAHHHRDAEPGGRRRRGHAGAARCGAPPAGTERQGRGGGRSGCHQERRQDPAGAEDQPVGVDARVRLGV